MGLIERYALVLASKKAENPGGGEGGEEGTKEGKELDNLLREMGMTPMVANPVTRELAGASMYHEELARQLAGFLGRGKGQGADLLKGRGGMLTLHDAFCLFNRCVCARWHSAAPPISFHLTAPSFSLLPPRSIEHTQRPRDGAHLARRLAGGVQPPGAPAPRDAAAALPQRRQRHRGRCVCK